MKRQSAWIKKWHNLASEFKESRQADIMKPYIIESLLKFLTQHGAGNCNTHSEATPTYVEGRTKQIDDRRTELSISHSSLIKRKRKNHISTPLNYNFIPDIHNI